MTHILLNFVNLVSCQMANLALMVMTEVVATFHHVVDEEAAIHTWTHVTVKHAVIVVCHYNTLCASVVISVVVNIGVCLTECCYRTKDHHTCDHHCLENRSLHNCSCFCEPYDSVNNFVFLFLGAKLMQKLYAANLFSLNRKGKSLTMSWNFPLRV